MAKKKEIFKVVKEEKKPATEYTILPHNTTIDVVAITQDKTYIFAMSFGDWLKIKKKPGVQYIAYQQGAAQFPEAIRTDYFNTKTT